jgi:hypothetical protein
MPTEPEQTEFSDAELSDQDLEVVTGGQGVKTSIEPARLSISSNNEPPTSGTGPYNPTPRPQH